MKTPYLRWAAVAVLLLAPPGAFAKDAAHSSAGGIRSYQALPPSVSNGHPSRNADPKEVSEEAAASPPYCSGNKYGLYNGEGAAHGNGMPFSCGKSPG